MIVTRMIQDETWRSVMDQSWTRVQVKEVAFTEPGGRVDNYIVRLSIIRNVIDAQSTARAEVWSRRMFTWNELGSIPFPSMRSCAAREGYEDSPVNNREIAYVKMDLSERGHRLMEDDLESLDYLLEEMLA